MPKILISDSMDSIAEKILTSNNIDVDVKTDFTDEELLVKIEQYDGLIVRSATKVTKKIIERAKNLKIIGRAGAGVDNIDLASAKEKKIIVMNTPGGNTNATAEHTLALLMSLSRKISKALEIFLDKDISNASVCSAVALVFPPGVFITIIFFSLAEAKSILSTPAPALPIIFKFLALSMIFLVTFVADLTISPSYCSILTNSSSSVKSVFTSTSILFEVSIFSAMLSIESEIKILGINFFCFYISPL